VIIGDTSRFAIESGMTKAYARLSFRALGFFVIYLGGRQYGVRASDATLLACSFGEVEDRIARSGRHTAPFAADADAGMIADAYRDAIYAPNQENERFFGFSQPEFRTLIRSHHLVWAPDGDEAFDDGSHVLHFDVKDRVRLIAFRSNEEGYHHNPRTLTDAWIDAVEFYHILAQWRDAFEKEWAAAPKISEADDGARAQ